MKAKNYLLIILVLFGLSESGCYQWDCDKTKPKLLTDAIITGVDYRECACCGGLMLTFGNDPKPYSSPYYLIRNMPLNTGINENSNFPVYVKVKYTVVQEGCGGNHIDISSLERR